MSDLQKILPTDLWKIVASGLDDAEEILEVVESLDLEDSKERKVLKDILKERFKDVSNYVFRDTPEEMFDKLEKDRDDPYTAFHMTYDLFLIAQFPSSLDRASEFLRLENPFLFDIVFGDQEGLHELFPLEEIYDEITGHADLIYGDLDRFHTIYKRYGMSFLDFIMPHTPRYSAAKLERIPDRKLRSDLEEYYRINSDFWYD